MKGILFVVLTLASLSLFAQDTTYFDSSYIYVNSLANASYYEIVSKYNSDTNRATKKIYYKSGKLKARYQYANYSLGIRHGKQLEFYPDGKQLSEIDYDYGKYNGLLKTWYENGQLRRKDSFTLGEYLSGKCFSSTGKDTTYFEYMVQPAYPGGEQARQQFLIDNIIYPDSAKRNGIQGKVYITFIVEPDGSLSQVKMLTGDKLLADEAIRVIKRMPEWIPGYKEGKKVRVKINMPVKFIVVE
jgi:TonB family protein